VPESDEGREGNEVVTKGRSHPTVFDAQYGSRQVLDLLSEKWTAHVLFALAFGVKRHGELKREIKGISQKMLTRTLRNLERDGLVERTVYHVVPPRVEYALTHLGETFSELLKQICTWAETHFAEIEAARVAYNYRAEAVGS
jgi:DNA-binding HxlR family transcriptional regulator